MNTETLPVGTKSYCTQCFNEINFVLGQKGNMWIHTQDYRHSPTPPPLTAEERLKFRELLNLIPINPNETIKDYVERFRVSAMQFDVRLDIVKLMKQKLTDMSEDVLLELLMRVKTLKNIENQIVNFDAEDFLRNVSGPTVAETVVSYYNRVAGHLTEDQFDKVKRLLLRKYCEGHFLVRPSDFSHVMFKCALLTAKLHDNFSDDLVVLHYELLMPLYEEYQKTLGT